MRLGKMADYIDRQALDVVAFTDRDGTFSDGIQWLLEYIDALPSADVVEVVRCEDCKHADEYYHCIFSTIWNDKNHYCGKGERRNG